MKRVIRFNLQILLERLCWKYYEKFHKFFTVSLGKFVFSYVHFLEPRMEYWTGIRIYIGKESIVDIITPIGQFFVMRGGYK